MNKELILIQTIYAAIVSGALGMVFWQLRKAMTKIDHVDNAVKELNQVMVEKYVRSLEKSVADLQKEIGCIDVRVQNLEREVFKVGNRRKNG